MPVIRCAGPAVYAWFVAALGMYFSLVLKSTSRAQASTVAVLLVTNVGTSIILSIWRCQSYILYAGCMPMIVGASAFNCANARSGLELFRNNPGACLQVWWSDNWTTESMIQAFALSLVLHGAAALLLTRAALRRFDRVVDRPRRPALSAAPPPPKPKPLPVTP